MAHLVVEPTRSLRGDIFCPGDKSISHRALLFSAMSEGISRIDHCLFSEDVLSTRRALEALGVSIHLKDRTFVVEGKGFSGFQSPLRSLDMGNSGTTTRLLLGFISGLPVTVTLAGDASLSQRPMRRVTQPLEEMGARIVGPNGSDRLPLTVQGGDLHGIEYQLPIPSAQVKSALLLAGLNAAGSTTIIESIPTRDHTERMLKYFGAALEKKGNRITVRPGVPLQGRSFTVPGDISSAAFFLAAGTIVPDSSITVRGVGLNPTRTGILDLLQEMGARVAVKPDVESSCEPAGDVTIVSGPLSAVDVAAEKIPALIDELPIFMVAATQARGKTIIHGAGELRVKETDRIHSMVTGLTAMGARISAAGDDILIEGPASLQGCSVQSFGDHRTAMSLAIAGLVAHGKTTINGAEWISISFPDFARTLTSLRA